MSMNKFEKKKRRRIVDLKAYFIPMGSRDGAVVRALASHQCGAGSIPGLGVICGLSLSLVLVPAPRVFLSETGHHVLSIVQ